MIGIIDYGAGNLFSLQCALDRVGGKYEVFKSPDQFDAYEKFIIPGVGHARPAMDNLIKTGLIPLIKQTQKPVLGVCVGMQLMTSFSEEGATNLTGIIPLKTKRFSGNNIKIPQMGWNKIYVSKPHPLFHLIPEGAYFYFVHSYFVEFETQYSLAYADYGTRFSAAIMQENFLGVQFHPEKSGKAGAQLLKNFVTI